MSGQLDPALILGIARAWKSNLQILGDAPGSAGHHDDPIAQEQRLPHVVGDEDDRLMSGGPDRLKELVHLGASLRVEGCERLIHQQHLRIHRQGTGQTDPHPHSAGELVGQ